MKIFFNSMRKFILLFVLIIPIPSKGLDFLCSDMNVQIRAGVAPTFWIERGDFSAFSCDASSLLGLPSPYVPLFEMPKFNKLFSVPWYIGAQVGCDLYEDQQIYVELNYRQSRARTFSLSSLVIPNVDTIYFSIIPQNNYRAVDFYIGMRAYWQSCWCDDISVFLGGKVGLMHYAKINFIFTTASLIVPPPNPFVSARIPFFLSNTVPAMGVNIGIAYEIGCDFSLVLTGELVATCGPRTNPHIPFDFLLSSIFINPLLAPNSFLIGSIGTVILVPITLGLKYRF